MKKCMRHFIKNKHKKQKKIFKKITQTENI